MHSVSVLGLVLLGVLATEVSALFFGGGGGGGGGCGCMMPSCGGGCGRKKRSIEEQKLEFFGIVSKDADMLCNEPELKQVMNELNLRKLEPQNSKTSLMSHLLALQNMQKTAVDSSKAMQWALERHNLHRYVVVCSENPFVFTIRADLTYCGARANDHYCHAFAI